MSDKEASQLMRQGNNKAEEILSLLASNTLSEALLSPEGKQVLALIEDYNRAYNQILAFNITENLGAEVRDIRTRARSINPMLNEPLDVDLLKNMHLDAIKKQREQLVETQKERQDLIGKTLAEKNQKIINLNAKSRQLSAMQEAFKEEVKALHDEMAAEGVMLDISLNADTRNVVFIDHLKVTGKKIVYQYSAKTKKTKVQDLKEGELRIAYEAFHFCDCI